MRQILSLLILSQILLFNACAYSAPPGVVGNEVCLPYSAELIAVKQTLAPGWQPDEPEVVYTKFNGKYPQGWPDGFKLPKWYCLAEPQLAIESAPTEEARKAGYRMISFTGVAPLSKAAAIDFFRNSLNQTGLKISKDEQTKEDMNPQRAGEFVHTSHTLGVVDPDPNSPMIMVEIEFRDDLDEWTEVQGMVLVLE